MPFESYRQPGPECNPLLVPLLLERFCTDFATKYALHLPSGGELGLGHFIMCGGSVAEWSNPTDGGGVGKRKYSFPQQWQVAMAMIPHQFCSDPFTPLQQSFDIVDRPSARIVVSGVGCDREL